jgi:hypothetical protein
MTSPQRDPSLSDDDVLAGRIAWLAGAGTEEEARLIESALLAQTDNGLHEGDPEQHDLQAQGVGR